MKGAGSAAAPLKSTIGAAGLERGQPHLKDNCAKPSRHRTLNQVEGVETFQLALPSIFPLIAAMS